MTFLRAPQAFLNRKAHLQAGGRVAKRSLQEHSPPIPQSPPGHRGCSEEPLVGKQHPRRLIGPRICHLLVKSPSKSEKNFKMNRHLFGSQEVFFTMGRAGCLPLPARLG